MERGHLLRNAAPIGFGLVLLASGCMAHRPPEYVLTPDVTGDNRARLIENFEKGKVLYQANCAACHGGHGQGRDTIPSFSEAQVQSYMASGQIRTDQRNHAVGRRLSQQQLDYVFTFLRLLRPSAR